MAGFTVDEVSRALGRIGAALQEADRMDPVTSRQISEMAAKPWWAPAEWWRKRVLSRR